MGFPEYVYFWQFGAHGAVRATRSPRHSGSQKGRRAAESIFTGAMTDPKYTRPELLAPTGSIESFHAAIDAGADAVYLGLNDFNARLRAKNFSTATLAWLLPYAHERKVRVYVTLNTLIKQAELEPLINTLYELEQLGVDAIIVADAGLIGIARTHFPKIRLHASTQMTVHNSAGAAVAEKLGCRRAILSRECTLDEIALIRRNSRIELEVFVHGALCYGVSGLCLASSFLGGSSGNRGRCTQVCRRKFATAGTRGYFFSPDDLCAIGLLPRIIAAGVTSLKIEGRMKGPEYVYAVVRAYRAAIDTMETALIRDFGRPKTTFFLNGLRNPGIINASRQSGIGEFCGTVVSMNKDTVAVESAAEIGKGDRIRIQPESGFEGEIATVLRAESAGGKLSITLKQNVACSVGDSVYLVGQNPESANFGKKRGFEGVVPLPFRTKYPAAGKILSTYGQGAANPHATTREKLWVTIDNIAWLDHLLATPCQTLVLAGGANLISSLLDHTVRFKQWRSRLVPALPWFISEHELPAWQTLIDRCAMAGVTRWQCSNIGHRHLFGKSVALVAGPSLNCLNRASQKALLESGYSLFTYSSEDDYLNIKASASPDGIFTLFARPPLFISRVHPAVKAGVPFSDPHDNRFFTVAANGLHYMLPEKPVCFTHRRKKLSDLGIRNFLIDLSFCDFDPHYLQIIMECYKNGTKVPGTEGFNFKAGLK